MLLEAQNIIRNTLLPTDRLVVGLSGGADSVALAHLLYSMGYELILVHVNFHLRGEESDRDEAFVRQLYSEQFPHAQLRVFSADTYSIAGKKGISIEMAAREIRYDYFEGVARDEGGNWIAVGHHADDQIETVLLNLSRQTGINGLAGMQVVAQRIFRPLLSTWKSEILEYLETNGLKYVTDSTNFEDIAKRNYIRHHLVKRFEGVNPSFRQGALESIKHLREEADVLNRLVDFFEVQHYNENEQSIELKDIISDTNKCFFFKRYLTAKGFTYSQADDILCSWNSEKTTTYMGRNGMAQCYRGKLYFIYNVLKEYSIQVTGACKIPHIGEFSLETPKNAHCCLGIDGKYSNAKLTLRAANKNDVFQPFGMKKGGKSVFRYLGEKGVPEYYRAFCPVLESNGTILSVLPFEVSERAKYTNKTNIIGIQFHASKTPLGAILNAHLEKKDK